MLCDFGNQSILLGSIYRNATQRTDDIAKGIPEHGVLDEERRFHAGRPDKSNRQKEINIGAVGHQRHDGFAPVREFTLHAPTKHTENRSADLARQEIPALRQIVTQHLPLHCASSLLKTSFSGYCSSGSS